MQETTMTKAVTKSQWGAMETVTKAVAEGQWGTVDTVTKGQWSVSNVGSVDLENEKKTVKTYLQESVLGKC